MSATTLVNGIYPLSYFSLPGVDSINYPDTGWWSSISRYAAVDGTGLSYQLGGAPTTEYLEIDLGRIREVNYVNFDVLRAPIDISIEYDIISDPDRDSVWLSVQPVEDLLFENSSSFSADNRTAWFNAEFNFTDTKGNMVHTRYLRLGFTRRDESWPTSTSSPFPWPVFVKSMRVGRYVSELIDSVGPLLTQDTPNDIVEVDLPTLATSQNVTYQARQQFVISDDAIRAGVTPNILGFGVLINTKTTNSDDAGIDIDSVAFWWGLYDVTNSAEPTLLQNGIANGALTSGLSWLDWYLDDPSIIAGDTTLTYELRISSLNAAACSTVYTHSPNGLSTRTIPGSLEFTNGTTSVGTTSDTTSVVAIGDYIVRTDIPDQPWLVSGVTSTTITLTTPYMGSTATVQGAVIFPYTDFESSAYTADASRNLVMRVWADIGDEGRDVLGNAYRYVTRRQQAQNVTDSTKPGWMSKPVPTPEAVEALYFDVRGADSDNNPTMAVIDAIKLAPRTPGVQMNVYFSQQGLHGKTPNSTDDWDYLLWTPVPQTYTLRRKEVIQLPTPIRACFMKLEFTDLRPLPYELPTYPPLPPVQYRRFPTWIETLFNNVQVRNVIADWFLRNATPVETKVLQSLSNPVLEFEYEQREFLAALALGQITDQQTINSGIVDVADNALIDPTTASKVYVTFGNQFQNSLLLSVDQSSVLGQAVVNRYDPTTITDQFELSVVRRNSTIPVVSTTNDRISESYQNMAAVPMRFHITCRHEYTIEQAEFNKKAYFVGIDTVEFLRNDYTVVYDDALIQDILYDDLMLVEDTFVRESETTIPDGTTVYVSYQNGSTNITDEAVYLSGFTGIPLSVVGSQARNVLVYGAPNQQGVQYFQNQDYQLLYATDGNGNLVTVIERSDLSNRLTVPIQPIIYIDGGTVMAVAVIPNPPTLDSATVISVAAISGTEGPYQPEYGTGTYGGGTYGNLAKQVADSGTVISVAHESGVDTRTSTDAATVRSTAVISGTDTYTP